MDTSQHPEFFASREAITRFLFLSDPPAPVDLCFVLGSPSTTTIVPAIDLYTSGFTPRILISGMGPTRSRRAECDIYRDLAIARGVPSSAILTEARATNTLENFTLSRRIIEQTIGWGALRRIALVTKPFHTRRALMTARANWPTHLEYLMLPSSGDDDPLAGDWWQTSSGRQFVLAELRAIGTYALSGHLGGF